MVTKGEIVFLLLLFSIHKKKYLDNKGLNWTFFCKLRDKKCIKQQKRKNSQPRCCDLISQTCDLDNELNRV